MATPHFTEEVVARFWTHVEKTDGCWIWHGSRLKRGYGRMHINGTTWKAHRLSYLLHNNRLSRELIICHSCDNPSCVNPAHLSQGTNADNMRDRDNKFRMMHGERTNTAKLTEVQVLEIRARYAAGETNKSALAREYGVSNPLIGCIIRRDNWRHLK